MAAGRRVDTPMGHHPDAHRPADPRRRLPRRGHLVRSATSATTGAPPYGADADRMHAVSAQLRGALTGTEFRACTERGERLDSHQVIDTVTR
jgi:hypothetical protein